MFDKKFEESVNTTVAKNLSRILQSKNMTQLELSELMGVSTATISNWCNGIKLPRMDKIDKLCAILSINRSDLVDNIPSSSPAPLQLSAREEHLVVTFRGLNEDGQEKAVSYVDDLAGMAKYQMTNWEEQMWKDADEIVREEYENAARLAKQAK